MTRGPAGGTPPDPYRAMLRGALLGAVLTCPPLVAAGSVLAGSAGGLGALVGSAVVVIFSGSTLVVMGAARRLEPVLTLAVAMVLYSTKVGALLLLAPALRAGDWSHGWAAAAITAGTAAWSAGLVVAFRGLRLPVYRA